MKVIKRFRDKETKKTYNVGSTYDGTKKRAKEISAKGFIELEEKPKEDETVEEPKEKVEKKETPTKKEGK